MTALLPALVDVAAFTIPTSVASPIELSRCFDVDYLDGVMRMPGIWENIRDDSNLEPDKVHLAAVVASPTNIFLRVDLHGESAGFIAFIAKGPVDYELHTNLLPSCRGAKALEAGWMAVKWLFDHTDAERIETYVFDHAVNANRMMRWAHWTEFNSELHPHTVGGRVTHRLWYRYTRAEWETR